MAHLTSLLDSEELPTSAFQGRNYMWATYVGFWGTRTPVVMPTKHKL